MLTSAKIGEQNGDTRTRRPEPGYLNLSIHFFLNGVSFAYKRNPFDQGSLPKGRIWQKPGKGLDYGCTAKGMKEGKNGQINGGYLI
jgi:hypothetical protein